MSRHTPGPGYLETLAQANVNFTRTPIIAFTEKKIVTMGNVEWKVCSVICCTGANTDVLPPFPINVPGVGFIQDAWTPDPYTHLGLAAHGFPNLVFIQSPNATGYNGTVSNQIETQATYIVPLLRKVT
ncbi:MAG: hypothetical protein Q9190_000058 [Brigantiaea leucoxantha]